MTFWLHRRGHRGRAVLARCEEARRAISALRDGEQPGVPVAALDAHLASCGGCRDFEAAVARVERQVRVRASSRAVTPSLMAKVMAAFREDQPVGPAARRYHPALVAQSAGRAARWSLAVVPVVALVVAGTLSTGAASHHARVTHSATCSPKVLRW